MRETHKNCVRRTKPPSKRQSVLRLGPGGNRGGPVIGRTCFFALLNPIRSAESGKIEGRAETNLKQVSCTENIYRASAALENMRCPGDAPETYRCLPPPGV